MITQTSSITRSTPSPAPILRLTANPTGGERGRFHPWCPYGGPKGGNDRQDGVGVGAAAARSRCSQAVAAHRLYGQGNPPPGQDRAAPPNKARRLRGRAADVQQLPASNDSVL